MIYQGLSPLIFEGKSHDVSNYVLPPSFNMGWVLVRFLLAISSVQQQNVESQLGISFTFENMIQPGWYHVFMDEKQFEVASRTEVLKLYDPKSFKSIKRETSADDKYIVLATKNWVPKDKNAKVSNVYGNYYVVRNTTLKDLNEDPFVKQSAPHSSVKLFNRFVAGTLQKGTTEMTIQYIDRTFKSIAFRPLEFNNIDGQNQIVTVLDSGIDLGHCFFYDSLNDYSTVINKTNLRHRKVVRYESFINDFTDSQYGHGTHVSGTIAGDAYYPFSVINEYSGVAPKAKLYVVDLSVQDDEESIQFLTEAQFEHVIEQMKTLNSNVMSNSWGYEEQNSVILTKLYDELGMQTTFVAAGGNQDANNAIYAPADSKNVITVGWTTRPIASQVETGDVEISILFRDFTSVKVLIGNNVLWEPPENDIQYCDDSPDKCEYQDSNLMISPKAPEQPQNFMYCIVSESDYNKIKGKYASGKISLQPIDKSQKLYMNDESSRGPTLIGTLKPDVVAPGTSTYSAAASGQAPSIRGQCSIKNLISSSGSSMATPAISGSIAQIYQYFEEGWYPSGWGRPEEGFHPDPLTVKSVLISSARSIDSQTVPNYDQGFGMPRLAQVLGFDYDHESGMRTTLLTLEPDSHYTVKVNTAQKDEFVATICYNDLSTLTDQGIILLADVDLVVKDPKGNVYYGNNVKGEYTSTTEKVFIKEAPVGEYSIELIYPKVYDVSNLSVALTVTGGFVTADESLNPKDLVATKTDTCIDDCYGGTCNNGMCVCNESRAGAYCQHELHKIEASTKYDLTLTPRDIYYFTFNNTLFNISDTVFLRQSNIPNRVKVCLSSELPRTPTKCDYAGFLDNRASNITFPKDIGETIYGFIYTINHDPHTFSFALNDFKVKAITEKRYKKVPIWVVGLVGGVFVVLTSVTVFVIMKYVRAGRVFASP